MGTDTISLLFVIPHYVAPTAAGAHGSQAEGRQRRAEKLSATIARLHDLFPPAVVSVGFRERMVADPVPNRPRHELTVAVVTDGTNHVLSDLHVKPSSFVHVPVTEEPMLLGFAARDWLDDHHDGHDWYGYTEDDLLLDDPATLDKLTWFGRFAAPDSLLLPNRYEVTERDGRGKAYVDGALVEHHTREFQLPIDEQHPETIEARYLERPARFERATNPHSGFFLLSAPQFERWRATPYLRERDVSFSSALESAATLGLLKAFAIYKPSLADVPFLEIRHLGERYLAEILPPTSTIPPDGPLRFRASALSAEVDRLRHEVRRLEVERERLLGVVDEVLTSTSYRVTRPLRWASDRVRRSR